MVANAVSEGIKVKGLFRITIQNQDGSLAGDSGYRENLVTNEGFRNMLARLLGALAGSSQISHAAVGTGGAPAAADTTLSGEVVGAGATVHRAAVSASSSSNSKAVTFYATLSSAASFVTASANISNVGLFATSSGGTLFAGNTYTSSSVGTNQNVNITYTINFA